MKLGIYTIYPCKKRSSFTGKTVLSQNGSNHVAALREYRRLKDLRKGPISRIRLRKMTITLEETRNFFLWMCAARKRTETGWEGNCGRSRYCCG
ncbi:hypothetical protein TNCV_287011 [Trichonephila clavipes]|nr:hypothetical protein TNCV_287011 [Trichonephila clavipes]